MPAPPNYLWCLQPGAPENLAAELGVSDLEADLLANRGFSEPDPASQLLAQPELTSPAQLAPYLPDLGPALAILQAAKASQCKVLVWGDYDVDGLVGASTTARLLRQAGLRAYPRIPERTDGYGFTPDVVSWAYDWGAGLIVTVDNGIGADPARGLATKLGIACIVTDHHLPTNSLACAGPSEVRSVLDGSASLLCGSAVAGALAARFSGDQARNVLDAALGPLALATVADCVPMRGPNRALVRAGLAALRQAPSGLRALLSMSGAGLDPDCETLSYLVAPRINSAGRMNQASLALDLLMADDGREAVALVRKLEALNRKRRKLQADLAETLDVYESPALVWNVNVDCPLGLTGLVASQLATEHARPAFVLAPSGDGRLTGSARVPHRGHVSVVEALGACDDLLLRYGGHAAAAGLTVEADRADDLRDALEARLGGPSAAQPMPPVLNLDGKLELDQLTPELIETIRALGPFGEGFSAPWFLLTTRVVEPPATYTDGAHLSLTLGSPAGGTTRGIGFWLGDRVAEVTEGDAVSLAVRPFISKRTGNVEVKIKDIHVARKRKPKPPKPPKPPKSRKPKRKRPALAQ